MNTITKLIERLKQADIKSIQLYKNVALSTVIKGTTMIISLLMMPAYIHYFSNQLVLGMWFTAISILSWILTFDLGIGNGLRNHLVEPLVKKENDKVKAYISSAYFSVGIVVIILALISIIVIPLLNWNAIFNINNDIVNSDVLVFMVTMLTVGILLQFWLKLITSILYALQKSAIADFLSFVSSFLMLCFTLLMHTSDLTFNIKALSVAYIFTVNLPYLTATIILFKTKLKNNAPSIIFFKKKYANQIIKLGGIFFYLQILTMIIFSTNEFLISWLFNPQEVVSFQIYNKIFSIVSTLFNLAITPVWSGVTEACVNKDFIWVKRLYSKLNKMLLILVPFEILIVILMPMIIKFWLGNDSIQINIMYSIIFAVYNILFMKVSIDTSIIAGFGTLKIQTIALTLTTILKVLFTFLIMHYYSSWIAIVIANILALVPYIIVEYFDINYRFKSYLQEEYMNDF
jgi:O-antigen/teichoic acid export membrane protein